MDVSWACTVSTSSLISKPCGWKESCSMAHIGFVGLGTMGGRMVERVLAKGHTVTGYNRTRAKAEWLIAKGMRWADSPGAVCASADVVLSMVTNSQALEEIAAGIVPALKPGKG